MKKTICRLVILFGFLVLVGIIRGAFRGVSEWWCFPIMFGMWVAGKIGGFYRY